MILPMMDFVWETLARASLYAAILFPIAWIACRVLRRVPRRIHCWIWRLVYLKVIVASVWLIPINVPVLPAVEGNSTMTVKTVHDSGENSSGASTHSGSPAGALSPYAPTWPHILVAIWALGFVVSFRRSCQEWRHGLQIRQYGIPIVSGSLFEIYQRSARAVGISRPPELLETDRIDVPALVGIYRPAVVVPVGLAEHINADELGLILRHEIGHQKRLDLHWNLLARAVDVVLFFHPLTWLASRRWKMAQEAACDELVLYCLSRRLNL